MTSNSRKRQALSDGTDADVESRPRKRATLAGSHRSLDSVRQVQERNNRDSPFLRLPPEIRNRIYDLALGNKVIHIGTKECSKTDRGSYQERELYRNVHSSHRYVKLVHVVCSGAVDAEEVIYCSSKDSSQFSAPHYAVRHENCHKFLYDGQPSNPDLAGQMRQNTYSLPMDLTRVCRDIHREAALIPYANNTFAFKNGYELDLFVTKSLLAPQRAAISILQIDGYIAADSRYSGITCKVPKMLTGLHTLEIASPSSSCHMYTDSRFGTFSRSLETVRVVYEDKGNKEISAELKAQLRTQAERAERNILNKR
ncbi:hypothetical protein D0869_10522 [Hortaea werneckii]|uniref:DUF7730 domain-containing protein n=1 Tax=Hortaea werneckii TaxID=91943 RepID=A0A3M6WDU5_HORWE|nr:hypothetical protein KC324_g8630 [Hortaea werneckii]KAI7588880.1 hypothetical protein KC316_g4243 [Hortaea werneckii]RMX76659.1 hypothetical protein D0869_10522 [Hortaea werneckii]RMX98015.1 hypothetical protein D0868_10334 [Hortaea werneckii]